MLFEIPDLPDALEQGEVDAADAVDDLIPGAAAVVVNVPGPTTVVGVPRGAASKRCWKVRWRDEIINVCD